jgi:hypothetical protein
MTDEVTRLQARIAQLDNLLAQLDHCHRIMERLFNDATTDHDRKPCAATATKEAAALEGTKNLDTTS